MEKQSGGEKKRLEKRGVRKAGVEKPGSGLTFGHDLDSKAGVRSDIRTRTRQSLSQNSDVAWEKITLILGKTPLEVAKAEVVSECQT